MEAGSGLEWLDLIDDSDENESQRKDILCDLSNRVARLHEGRLKHGSIVQRKFLSFIGPNYLYAVDVCKFLLADVIVFVGNHCRELPLTFYWQLCIVNLLYDSVLRCKALFSCSCVHYRRRCRIRAPCCNEIFDCRHCHNEAKNEEKDPLKRHDVPRHKVEKVICSICNTEQKVQQICENCGVSMGDYFCARCKFYDDETGKEQFHCDACGICRVGGRDKFFHCHRCGCCYSIDLQKGHLCVEKSMHHDCPVCFEYLFESLKEITVLRCGHTMHLECLKEMKFHAQYTCPMCSKSVCDMSKIWEQLDLEVAATPMPLAYQNKMVWILCNDCGANNEVYFHVIAQKCLDCKSYNTRQTRGVP